MSPNRTLVNMGVGVRITNLRNEGNPRVMCVSQDRINGGGEGEQEKHRGRGWIISPHLTAAKI